MSRWVVLVVLLSVVCCSAGEVVITLNPSNTFQEMKGFGAALTDSSAWLIDDGLSSIEKQALLEELFSESSGIGLNYIRLPMGASDFRLTDYTYDDMPSGETDYALTNFSIAHDESYIIPILQDIQTVNTNLRIMASPWSAPAWMKDSDDLYDGKLKSDAYLAYAKYFMKFVQSYASNGLAINAVSLQNEPLHEPFDYPGMPMSVSDQIGLAIDVGHEFESNSIATDIIVYDHNWDQYSFPISVMDNATANPYIAGSAFHGYGGDVSAQSLVHVAHTNKDIYFTEVTAGDWSGSWGGQLLWDVSTLIIGATRNYAKTVLKWNLALDQDNGPKISGGCDTCYGVVTINTNTSTITKNPDYYALGHASKFVRPGAVRIDAQESPADGPYSVAFINPDDTLVVIAFNADSMKRDYVIRWSGESANYVLPAESVATFTWSNTPGAEVDVWLTTADQNSLLEEQTVSLAFHPLTLDWAGRTWDVRDTEGNPGGNRWAASCAYVDTNDYLRLEVKSENGEWYCGEVDSVASLGHGTYRWSVVGKPDQLNSNVVAGLATYFDSYHGVSVDFGEAYQDEVTNTFYTVEPYYEVDHREGFSLASTSDYTTHEFTWNPRKVEYRSWYGHTNEPASPGAIIAEWTYEGDDVPNDTNEHVRMNLWMFDGAVPVTSQELVLADFVYEASIGGILADDFEDDSLNSMWLEYGEGTVLEFLGVLRLLPGDTDDETLGVRTVDSIDWGDNGLTYAFSANMATATVTTLRSAGGPDLWGYQALVSGSNGVYDPYAADNAAILCSGYDVTGDVLTIEFLTKTAQSNSWGTSRYIGTIASASSFFTGDGLELQFSLVYGDYSVSALFADSPVSVTLVSGAETGTHNLGTALYEAEYIVGSANNDDGRGTVFWEEVSVVATAELKSTVGDAGNGGPGETEIQIGDADHGTTWRSPIDTRYQGHRSQVLYDADFIDRSGSITQLLIYVLAPPDMNMDRYTIRMQHSTLDNLSESFINSGWTTVYQADTLIPSDTRGWYAFNLTNVFAYNGTNNLLIDFTFLNSSKDDDPLPTASYTYSDYNSCISCSSDRDDPLGWTGYPRGRKFKSFGTRRVDVRLVFPEAVAEPIGLNLSFEDGPLGFATNVPNWSAEGSEYSGSIKATPVLHKDQSLKIWKDGGNGDQKLYQFFEVDVTNQYTLSGYILSQSVEPFSGSNAYGAVILQWFDASGLMRTDQSAHFTDSTMLNVWNYFDVSGVPPSGCTSGRIACALFSSVDQQGSLYFDKLDLTAQPAPPSTDPVPVAGTTYLYDEFNDTSMSNCWQRTGDIGDASYWESGGSFGVRPGTNWNFQHSGYVSTQPIGWSNTNGWHVFSATLSTVAVDSVSGTNDIEVVLGVCSEPDNPWYVTNSCALYGYYDQTMDQLIVQLLTKSGLPSATGNDRFNASISGVSDYLNETNSIRMSIALGEEQYDLRLSDSSGMPVPVTVHSGSPRGLHMLGESLCTAYWVVGAQNDGYRRGTVYWDRTEVYDTLAPVVVAPSAIQTSIDGSGVVIITNGVTDPNGTSCRLSVQASTNAGGSWFPIWATDVSGDFAASVASHQGAVQVVDVATTNSEGYLATNVMVITWDTLHANNATDMSDSTITNALLRVEADDGAVGSLVVTSAVFVLDNQGPASSGATVSTEGGGAYTFDLELDASWSGFNDEGSTVDGYYASLSDGGGTTAGIACATSPCTVTGGVEDVVNSVYVWARDGFGNIGSASSDDIVVLSAAGDYDNDGLANDAEESVGADPLDVDSDDDDMGDGWELFYGLNPTNPVDATMDLDGDGYDNRHEFFCDTHPSNITSSLDFCASSETGGMLIEWMSATGRVYDLYSRDDLTSDWQVVAEVTNMPGTGVTMSYTGLTVSAETRFYQLKVTRP